MGARPRTLEIGLVDFTILRRACRLEPIYAKDIAALRHTSKRAVTRVLKRLLRARLLKRAGPKHSPYCFYYVPLGLLSSVWRALELLWETLKAGLSSIEVEEPP